MRVLIASLLVVFSAHGADLPSGASLVDRFIEKSGGAEAYAKAKNVAMNGSVEMVGRNITGTVTILEEGPKSYTAMDFAGIGRIEEGFDGETAWENSALQGPRIMEGDEKVAAKRASSLSTMTNWRDVYSEAKTESLDEVDGKPAWKVAMTPKEGRPETFYFDRDSGLLVRISTVLATPLGEISTTVTMSDYRPVDGIQTAFTMTQNAMSQVILMKFNKVAYNAAVPKERFDLPEGIRALVQNVVQKKK